MECLSNPKIDVDGDLAIETALLLERDFFSGAATRVLATRGDKQYSTQTSGSKRSKSYLSPVSLSTKHRPFSGRNTKLDLMKKLTSGVNILELNNTESPNLKGPKILGHSEGTPA
ncbi:hypothetical protein WICPIJ_003324 [Wickerhamomyces pijperi]|uniref:Uncharacterized protein n=1 Tax=Wickerhamomyces pijperi TaxID=599730 RepID=A0A9P8QA69_WICPI|nr:hypothetical protein WICPIJ_003324 [Wickerhamomyces pijperi]